MGKDKTPETNANKYVFYAVIITIGILVSYSLYMVPKQIKVNPTKIKSFALVTEQATDQPVTSPTDPYSPMPLRVGTVGAGIYHRPFCKYAKQALITHGLPKRTNYFTREQVAANGRIADTYCIAGIFDCSDVTPAEFAASGNDPWCGANIRLARYDAYDAVALADKTLCSLDGFIGIFVDDPAHCVDGKVQSSDVTCDQTACSTCTVDCSAICDGCVIVTQSIFNQITLGMGDANRDAQADKKDYPYFHECFSGPIAATIPCQNVFDYDKDADVDEDDFDLFADQSYNTGNVSWAAVNFPTAVVNAPKTRHPLRVGIEGSQYYHLHDCPSVNASWTTWGIDKKEIFSTWSQVEASGRIPDTNASKCLAGTRDNPSGLQNCVLDECWTVQGLPVDLHIHGTTMPASRDVTLTLNPGWKNMTSGATHVDLVLTGFDLDTPNEGRLSVNGTETNILFANGLAGDKTVGELTISTDITLYQDGANIITFWHDRTDGYRIDSMTVNLTDCKVEDNDGDGTFNCDDNCPNDPNKTEPGICGCGFSDTDTDNNGTPDCNDPVVILYEDTFDTTGEIAGWLDTEADNSLVEDTAPPPGAFFVMGDLSGAEPITAFATQAGSLNRHSHYIASAIWTGYKYSGKMMARTGSTDIGVTFFSDYPNSDTYYRLRSWNASSFHIAPHGTVVTGTTDTGITPVGAKWYNFRVWVRNTTTNGTEISAKVWAEGDPEPAWQVNCNDNSITKRTQGSFGVWSANNGIRFWDDIKVTNY